MSMRQDPMAAAAELIVLLESLCKRPKDFLSYDGQCNGFAVESLSGSLVCTVGEISSWPSASNVIPGQARTFSPESTDHDTRGEFFFCNMYIMNLPIAGNIHSRFTCNWWHGAWGGPLWIIWPDVPNMWEAFCFLHHWAEGVTLHQILQFFHHLYDQWPIMLCSISAWCKCCDLRYWIEHTAEVCYILYTQKNGRRDSRWCACADEWSRARCHGNVPFN